MIPKSLTSSSSDWDVLKFRSHSDSCFMKENAYSRRILPGAKRKQSNFNDFLLAVGSKLSDSKGPYTELFFKSSQSTSTPKTASRPRPRDENRELEHLRNRTRSLQQRHSEFLKRRSLSTGNLPMVSSRKNEVLDVLDQILQKQEMNTMQKYLLNDCWVKVQVLEDTEL